MHKEGALSRVWLTSPTFHCGHLARFLIGAFALSLAMMLACPDWSQADVRVVKGTGAHRMSDRETKADAVRLALEQAKKHALEQVASYLESVTVVRDLDITQDEIRSYTAGMVLVLDQQVRTELDGEIIVIRVELTAQVDTDEVARAIDALKQNEDAREQLLALRRDVDHLQQKLEAANGALAAATSPEQAQRLTDERKVLLDRAQSDAMVAQAWTDWVLLAPILQSSPSTGLAQVHALLALASRLSPDNPHLALAQQTVGIKSPPAPPQPRRPPVPHTVPFLPGYDVPPQQPGQADSTPSTSSRQQPSIYQLNPLSPTTSGQPPQTGGMSTILQAPAQPGRSLQNSGRGMMPTYRQIPPANGRPTPLTLHTYQAESERVPSPAPRPSIVSPGISPPVSQRVPGTTPTASLPGPPGARNSVTSQEGK